MVWSWIATSRQSPQFLAPRYAAYRRAASTSIGPRTGRFIYQCAFTRRATGFHINTPPFIEEPKSIYSCTRRCPRGDADGR